MILHPDRSRILKQDVPLSSNRLFDMAINGFEGSDETVNSRSRRFLVSFKRLDSTNWILASNYPAEEAYEPVHCFQAYFFAFMTIMVAISCFAVWAITTSIISKLERFARFINGIDPAASTAETRFEARGNDEVSILAGAFNNLMNQLSVIRQALEQMGRTDHLTGLANRRELEAQALHYFSLARRQGDKIIVMLINIDHFKRVNDTYGHDVGDVALQHLATVLKNKLRPYDLLIRYESEEFLMLFLAKDQHDGLSLAERFRQEIASRPVLTNGREITLTISIGLSIQIENDELADIISRADAALYEAKRGGRNQVCVDTIKG